MTGLLFILTRTFKRCQDFNQFLFNLKTHLNPFSAEGYVAEDVLQYLLCFLLPRAKADAMVFRQICIHISSQNMEELKTSAEEKSCIFL